MMDAGRELDALIAEKIFGNANRSKITEYLDQSGKRTVAKEYYLNEAPHYSTDIAAAWQVVEKMNLLKEGQHKMDYQLWQCSNGWLVGRSEEPQTILAFGDTAPHAICLAALKALK